MMDTGSEEDDPSLVGADQGRLEQVGYLAQFHLAGRLADVGQFSQAGG